VWLFNPFWSKRRLNVWPELTDPGTNPAGLPVDNPVTGVTGTATTFQGNQSVAATGAASGSGTVTTFQGSQTVAGNSAGTASSASLTTFQGSQSVAGSGTVSAPSATGTATTFQGSQSVAADGSSAVNAAVATNQGGQTVAGSGAASASGTGNTFQGSQTTAATGNVSALSVTGTATTFQGSQSTNVLGNVSGATTPGSEQGGGGGSHRISFDEADRLKKQLRNLEAKRRKQWKEKKEFEDKIEQIYRDLYETPYQADASKLIEQVSAPRAASVRNQPYVVSLDYAKVKANIDALMQLIEMYQLFLDDEEAVSLLLLL
jgi:trimeric autotransporter adhesin